MSDDNAECAVTHPLVASCAVGTLLSDLVTNAVTEHYLTASIFDCLDVEVMQLVLTPVIAILHVD